MTNRERFSRTLRFETVDHPPLMPGGPWPATLRRWEQEGLTPGANFQEVLDIEPTVLTPVAIETVLFPPFEEKIIEETGAYIIKVDANGVKVRNLRDETSMPEHLEYPIHGPEDMEWLMGRLNSDAPGRARPDWLAAAQRARREGKVLGSNGGTYFAFLNEHMGTERLMTTYYDHPEFVHRVNDALCRLCEWALGAILPRFDLDYVGYHEDMAYRNGSMISPALFREFMTPYYKRVQRAFAGPKVPITLMDSDGDIRELIPLWIECGITAFLPMEVAASMDMVRLREKYGRTIGMIGGFDKRILAGERSGIKAEVERLRPVIEGGGFIPGCDHSVPPDVSWQNYCYYVKCLKAVYGMP
jgi:uroporphyrinogen decarboxylase